MARTPEELGRLLFEERRRQAGTRTGYFVARSGAEGQLNLVDEQPRFFEYRPQAGDLVYLPDGTHHVVTGFCHMFYTANQDEFVPPFEDYLPLLLVK